MEQATLNVRREMVEACRVKLSIEVPAETVQKTFAKILGDFRKHGRIDGFRPGKTPEALLRRHYGKRMQEEAQRTLIQETTDAAVKQEKLAAETQPRLEDAATVQLRDGAAFSYTVTFDVAPEVTLPDYRAFNVSRAEAAVPETTVDQTIQEWIQRRASFTKTEREAHAGDMLKVSWFGTLTEPLPAGEEVPERSRYILENQDGWLIMKSPEIIPGATEAMLGAKAGEERTFKVVFPDNYFVKPLIGRSASYSVIVKEVQEPEQVQLTDEVAKQYGHKDAGEMKTAVASYLGREAEMKQREAMRRELMEQLLKVPEFPLPPAVLGRQEIDTFVRLYNEELRNGRKDAEVQADQEKLMAKAKGIARQDLRRHYILNAVAELEKIGVSYEDLGNAVTTMAKMQNTAPKALYKQLEESGRLGALFEHLRETKTVDHLLTICKINGQEQKKAEPAAAPTA